jgi:hypothetical protein
MFASAFPDWHTTLEDLIAAGDKVAMRGVAWGTHKGVYGLGGHAPAEHQAPAAVSAEQRGHAPALCCGARAAEQVM